MPVEFETSEYEFAHGKKPRGQGTWAFFFDRGSKLSEAFWHNGPYAEAKKAAREIAKAKGCRLVRVGS